jgi:hypothetical protein
MELAQPGVYQGQDPIRAFLHEFGGAKGPHENQLGNHLNRQPVIHVSPDGKTALVRARVLQMMGRAEAGAIIGSVAWIRDDLAEAKPSPASPAG